MRAFFILTALFGSGLIPQTVAGLDYVTIRRDEKSVDLTGEVVTEAEDGGLLLRDRQNVLWAVPREEIVRRSEDRADYAPLSRQQFADRLLEELPGFRLHHTNNYLIAYDTSPAYAKWCGALYERLYLAFRNYWQRRGFQLRDPDTPLIAIVFGSAPAYRDYARSELGDAAANIVGYYSLRTNRVTMYDLTGTQTASRNLGRVTTSAQVNLLLMQPGAEQMVATIVHEATHQLAYNCGFHTRLADVPLWVSEGLAVYFETPDLRSAQGWRNIGEINRYRLEQFYSYLPRRDRQSLQTLLSSDDRFRQPGTALDAYAEAWSLNYFLLRKHPGKFIQYLQQTSEKPPLIYDSPEERLAAFRGVFGDDLEGLDAEFVEYMGKVR